MKNQLKSLLSALLLAGLCSGAQAAYFERVSYVGTGGYSALTEGNPVSDAVLDLSPAAGDVTLFGANLFTTSFNGGSLEHGYAADAFLTFSQASTDLSMSLSQSLSATATGSGANSMVVSNHQQDAFVDLSAVTLKIMGGAGEGNGSAVQVSFAGTASSLFELSGMSNGGYLGLGLSVSRGNAVLGDYLWDVTQSDSQLVNFSFAANVGEELSFSSYMLGGVGLQAVIFGPSSTPYSLAETGASLNGSFTVTAVPEPATYASLLAGLGLLGLAAARRKSKV